MSVEEAYYEFHLLLNKNAALKNVKVSRANYVFLFNREASLQLRNILSGKRNVSEIHDFQELLISNVKLDRVSKKSKYDEFLLPENYFEFVESESEGMRDNCKTSITNYLYKPKENHLRYSDSFYINFDFEESLCSLSDNKLLVYKKDWDINSTYLTYYKSIPKIDMSGYEINGVASTDVAPQFSDRLVHIINSFVVVEVQREFENQNAVNLSKDRVTL